MSNFQGLYDVRDATDKDINFILATFLRGLYYGDSWFSSIPKNIFMENYKQVAQALVNHPSTIIKIACLREDSEVILGYSLLGNKMSTVHFVYVKSAWRKQGIGRSLLPQFPARVTHLTALGKSLMSKLPNTEFNPFLTKETM